MWLPCKIMEVATVSQRKPPGGESGSTLQLPPGEATPGIPPRLSHSAAALFEGSGFSTSDQTRTQATAETHQAVRKALLSTVQGHALRDSLHAVGVMESQTAANNKRPADAEQTVDTFAVCPRCSRLSRNLRVCDKCASPLSEDNAAVCYSSSPKRGRADTDPTTGGKDASNGSQPLVNGLSSPENPVVVSSSPVASPKPVETMNGGDPPRPVPQALYVNKNIAQLPHPVQLSHNDVAPQSLFMNVNNQTAVSSSAPVTLVSMNSNNNINSYTNQPPRLTHMPVVTTVQQQQQQQQQAAVSQGFSSGPHVGMVTNVVAANTASIAAPTVQHQQQQQQRPVVSMQVNPGVSVSHGISSLGNISAASATMAPVQNHMQMARAPAPMPPTQTAQPLAFGNSSNGLDGDLSYMPGQVQFFATQIRIGTRKFKPSTPVMVKDDGVLFTLKDHPHAPVLLNARALLRCKVNLGGGHYPVMFLQLERSCMRQIRTIFQISENDFCDTASVYMKACITIFPLFPVGLTNMFVKGVKEAFSSMQIKYNRVEELLESISPDEVIDLLIQTAVTVPAVAATTSSTVPPSHSSVASQRMQTRTAHQQHQMMHLTTNHQRSTSQQSHPAAASDLLRNVAHSMDQQQTSAALRQQQVTMVPRPNGTVSSSPPSSPVNICPADSPKTSEDGNLVPSSPRRSPVNICPANSPKTSEDGNPVPSSSRNSPVNICPADSPKTSEDGNPVPSSPRRSPVNICPANSPKTSEDGNPVPSSPRRSPVNICPANSPKTSEDGNPVPSSSRNSPVNICPADSPKTSEDGNPVPSSPRRSPVNICPANSPKTSEDGNPPAQKPMPCTVSVQSSPPSSPGSVNNSPAEVPKTSPSSGGGNTPSPTVSKVSSSSCSALNNRPPSSPVTSKSSSMISEDKPAEKPVPQALYANKNMATPGSHGQMPLVQLDHSYTAATLRTIIVANRITDETVPRKTVVCKFDGNNILLPGSFPQTGECLSRRLQIQKLGQQAGEDFFTGVHHQSKNQKTAECLPHVRTSESLERQSLVKKLVQQAEDSLSMHQQRQKETTSLPQTSETPAERGKRLTDQRLYQWRNYETETEEQRTKRLAADRERQYKRQNNATETEEQRTKRLAADCERQYKRRHNGTETEDQRTKRLAADRERQYKRRHDATETEAPRTKPLTAKRLYQRQRIATETDAQRKKRLTAQLLYQHRHIATETEAQRTKRLIAMRLYKRQHNATETEDQKRKRLAAQRQRQYQLYKTETEDQRKKRLALKAARQRERRAEKKHQQSELAKVAAQCLEESQRKKRLALKAARLRERRAEQQSGRAAACQLPPPRKDAVIRKELVANAASQSEHEKKRKAEKMTAEAASRHVICEESPDGELQPSSPRPPPPYQSSKTTISQAQQPQMATKNVSGAPTLIVPNDPMRWQSMQKNLVVGGVYHVQMSDGKKRYCLWNGSRLVPCLVQNSEVQLEAVMIRIGSLRGTAVGKVRVKADAPAGILFTLFAQHCGNQSIYINFEDVTSCKVCFDKMSCLFISPSWNSANKIRNQLTLGQSLDPAFNVHSKEEHQKHIVMFLKDVNPDQRDALMQMRFSNRCMFEDISIVNSMRILNAIHTKVPSKNNSYLHEDDAKTKAKYQSLVATMASGSTPDDEDDDDDVIMTQEEVGIKCPYTQQVMKEPVRNKICNHNYEKDAIYEFMMRKKGVAKCPYAGCANITPLAVHDLEPNTDLKNYIREKQKGS